MSSWGSRALLSNDWSRTVECPIQKWDMEFSRLVQTEGTNFCQRFCVWLDPSFTLNGARSLVLTMIIRSMESCTRELSVRLQSDSDRRRNDPALIRPTIHVRSFLRMSSWMLVMRTDIVQIGIGHSTSSSDLPSSLELWHHLLHVTPTGSYAVIDMEVSPRLLFGGLSCRWSWDCRNLTQRHSCFVACNFPSIGMLILFFESNS